MRFTETLDTSSDADAIPMMWFPESLDYEQHGELVEISVDGETRLALASLIHMAEIFTSQKEERTRWGHDCGVFAYACETGHDLAHINFHLPGAYNLGVDKIDVKGDGNPSHLADTRPGEIVFTEDAKPGDDDFFSNTPHFLVRATVDDGEPLYLSKFSTSGSIALSTIERSLEVYPAQTLGTISGIHILPPDER